MKALKALLSGVALCGGIAAAAPSIQGDYLESRTADVYTGPCFANGEVNLSGQEAILAWRVREGGWQGVPLQGLSVVAVVQARSTLGDPHASPYPARSVILVDEQASAAQREALVAFAHSMGGKLLDEVVQVQSAPITLETGAGHGVAKLQAGTVASIATRCLHEGDKHCGNEVVYYQPLTEVQGATAAYAVEQSYSGEALGTRWSCPDKRSAFIAEFSR